MGSSGGGPAVRHHRAPRQSFKGPTSQAPNFIPTMSSIPLHNDVYPAIDYSVTAGTLKNKVAVIAGASRGIGQQIAHSLAKAGANVALLSLSGENEVTKKLCAEEGVKVLSFKVDITDVPETEKVFKEIVGGLGEIDILVNNAAMLRRRPFAMDNVEDWWRVVEVNLKGVRLLVDILAHDSPFARQLKFFPACELAIPDVSLTSDLVRGLSMPLLQHLTFALKPLFS